MLVEILDVIDEVAQIVRVRGSVGEFDAFWMDPELPRVGDRRAVEVSFDGHACEWGEDIAEVDAAAATGIAFRDGYFYATGRATWMGDHGMLWLQLDADCLTSVETAGLPDQPAETPAGLVTVRATEVELWDTHI